jgi:hypothetical protein
MTKNSKTRYLEGRREEKRDEEQRVNEGSQGIEKDGGGEAEGRNRGLKKRFKQRQEKE